MALSEEGRKRISEAARARHRARRESLGIQNEKTCEQCGNTYAKPGNQGLDWWAQSRYCSYACRDAAWREGKMPRGPAHGNWKPARELKNRVARYQRLFPIEGQECEACGVPAEVRHHRDGDNENEAAENIVFLCHPCHMTLHKKRKRRTKWSPRKRAYFRRLWA